MVYTSTWSRGFSKITCPNIFITIKVNKIVIATLFFYIYFLMIKLLSMYVSMYGVITKGQRHSSLAIRVN